MLWLNQGWLHYITISVFIWSIWHVRRFPTVSGPLFTTCLDVLNFENISKKQQTSATNYKSNNISACATWISWSKERSDENLSSCFFTFLWFRHLILARIKSVAGAHKQQVWSVQTLTISKSTCKALSQAGIKYHCDFFLNHLNHFWIYKTFQTVSSKQRNLQIQTLQTEGRKVLRQHRNRIQRPWRCQLCACPAAPGRKEDKRGNQQSKQNQKSQNRMHLFPQTSKMTLDSSPLLSATGSCHCDLKMLSARKPSTKKCLQNFRGFEMFWTFVIPLFSFKALVEVCWSHLTEFSSGG